MKSQLASCQSKCCATVQSLAASKLDCFCA